MRDLRAKCHANYNYEKQLTEGKEYRIRIVPGILPCSPLALFIDDNGKESAAHAARFTIMEESSYE